MGASLCLAQADSAVYTLETTWPVNNQMLHALLPSRANWEVTLLHRSSTSRHLFSMLISQAQAHNRPEAHHTAGSPDSASWHASTSCALGTASASQKAATGQRRHCRYRLRAAASPPTFPCSGTCTDA